MRNYGNRLRRIARLLAASLLLGLLLGQGAFAVDGKRTVRVACGINSVLYFDEDGSVTGGCKEYLDQLARINGWEMEYVKASWNESLEMLESGEIDLLLPVSKSQERMETMDYCDIVGGYTASGLFVLNDSDYDYENYDSFNGARIAVTENSNNAKVLAAFAEEREFSYEPVYIGTTEEKIQALQNGTVDMLMFNAANEVPGAKLVSVFDAQPFYYVVKKGNEELLSELNSGMQDMVMEHPDIIAETYSKCISGSNGVNRIALTAEEKELIESGREVVVGFYQNTEPLAYVDDEGEYRGIYIELMNMVEEASGLRIKLYPISREDDWQAMVKRGDIDFYIGVSDSVDMEPYGFQVTGSVMEYETILVTKNNYELHMDDEMTLALTEGRSYWAEELLKDLPSARILYCKTPKDCLLAVRSGGADVAMLNTIEYNYESKNARFSNLIQWANFNAKSGVVLAADLHADPVMFSAMNKALGTLSESQVSDLINTNLNMPYSTADFWDNLYAARNVLLVVGGILSLLIAVLIVVFVFRRRQRVLRRGIQERERRQLRILAALSLDYVSIYMANLDADTFEIVELTDSLQEGVAQVARRGTTYSGTMGKYVREFVLPEYRDAIEPYTRRENLIQRFQTEKDFLIRYQVAPNKKGQEFFEVHFVDASEQPDEHLMVVGFRCVDVVAREEIAQKNALKSAFEAADSASRAKSEFLSKMSHDIRTPMNAIIGMTAIAAAHVDDRERVMDALGKITASSRHLLSLINEVLDMSKIESGKIELAEEEFNLSQLLTNTLQIIQPQVDQHHHQLEVHILGLEHEDVVGDSLRVQQVFVNILGNSVKYTPNGGLLRLTVREKIARHSGPYGCYEFVFEDNGVGMTKEFQEHIFEPFARAEDVRISKIQGTGLGMAITHNIVRMMNGSIQIESEPEKGSRFTVTIFLRLQEQRDSAVEELAGLPVLVADDDQIACESACQMLLEIGMEGSWVLSGREAVEQVQLAQREQRDFYAVILDWKMPEMDGVETARAIRRVVGPEVPVIILSAYDWSEIETEAREAGVDAFLSKPVFKSSLVRLFKNLRAGTTEAESEKKALDGVMESDYAQKRALLVEDNELNREIAMEILQMTGMRVDTAEDGKVALDLFAASAPGYYDMIFMDIQMPVMNGYESARAIRRLDRADALSVPIVTMTANAFSDDVLAAKNAGMNEHLSKPLDFDKLTQVLQQYLGN